MVTDSVSDERLRLADGPHPESGDIGSHASPGETGVLTRDQGAWEDCDANDWKSQKVNLAVYSPHTPELAMIRGATSWSDANGDL